YILEKVIEHLNQLSSEASSFLYGNVIKEYHDKLAFLKTVENEDENTKELERLQKIAFDVENNTLNSLVYNGDITTNILDKYMRYAERTQVYKQSSLNQLIKDEMKTIVVKSRIKTKVRSNEDS